MDAPKWRRHSADSCCKYIAVNVYFVFQLIDFIYTQTNDEICESSQSTPPFAALANSTHGHSGTGSHSASVRSATVTRSATPAESDASSLKKAILLQLGISPELSDRTEGGLRHAYEKYVAYLQACKTYGEMMANKSWVGEKLTAVDLIELFVSKSYFHSHYKKFFSKVSNYPDLADWLEGSPDAPSDVDIWGEEKGSYHFKDLERFMEEHDRKMKMKKVKGNKSNKGEGGSKKAGNKKKKQVNNQIASFVASDIICLDMVLQNFSSGLFDFLHLDMCLGCGDYLQAVAKLEYNIGRTCVIAHCFCIA